MKNIFGIKNDSEKMDGKDFIIREIKEETEKEIDTYSEKENDYEKKASLPKPLGIIQWLTFIIGFLCLAGIFDALGDISLKEAYQNAPYIFIITIISLLTSLILYLINKHLQNKVIKSEEFNDFQDDTHELINKAFKEINVPNDAKEIDVFIYPYKLKKEKEVSISSYFKYINSKHKVFLENNNLCFATIYDVVAIPLKSITKIKEINKKAAVYGWNKEESFNTKAYKEYKIKSNQYDTLFIKPYYSLQINDYYGEYEILIPCYDIQVISELINLPIEKEESI